MIAANATAIIIVGAAAAIPCQLGDVANVSVPDGGSHYMYRLWNAAHIFVVRGYWTVMGLC